ncbi:MAG: hypothetical protein ACRBDL_08790 [Alphaproteobacteria bacterium]
MRAFFLIVVILFSFTGAGFYVFANEGITLGELVCGNPKYKTFKFKNGTEFTIPEAYISDRFGLDFGTGKDDEYVDLIVVEMHRNDGRPNCEKVKDSKKGFMRVSIMDHNFDKVLQTRHNNYPYMIAGEEEQFDLFRSVNSNDPFDLLNIRDFLIPKDQNFRESLFIRCTRSGAHTKPNVRLGCTSRSKLTDRVMIKYGFNHQFLSRYQEIDTAIQNTVSKFVTSSQGK